MRGNRTDSKQDSSCGVQFATSNGTYNVGYRELIYKLRAAAKTKSRAAIVVIGGRLMLAEPRP